MFGAPEERDVGGVILSLEQSFSLKVNQSVLAGPGQYADHLVRNGLVDIKYIFEQHQCVAVAKSKSLRWRGEVGRKNIICSHMIEDNPAQVQYFQRDGFLIFLAPDKSYQ